MGRSKKDAQVTKRKGALAMAASAAANAKRVAEKSKGKRGRGSDSDDELPLSKKNAVESEEEQSEEEGDAGSTASENEILQLEAEAEIKQGQSKLQALERNKAVLEAKIKAAEKTNENKLCELRETLDAFPATVSSFILYVSSIANADLHFGQQPPKEVKREIDVNAGPFAAFLDKKAASAMQKFIVPWNIALHGLSFAKKLTDKEIKSQLIAIIDSENLLPGFDNCAEIAAKHSVAFGDLAKRVKAAAGMY